MRNDMPSGGSQPRRAIQQRSVQDLHVGVSRRRRPMQGALLALVALSAMLVPRAATAGWRAKAIGASFTHTCAVTSGGAVQCWGDNGFGQLGDGTTTGRLTPVAVTGLGSGVVAVATGDYHT